MRKSLGLILAAAMMMSVVAVGASSGGAATTGLTCTGLKGTVTWTPPVPNNTTKVVSNVKATGSFTGCTGTPGITSGKFTFTSKGTTPGNCTSLIGKPTKTTASNTVVWNNKKTSVSAKLTLTPAGLATYVIGGKVTSGTQFVGKSTNATTLFIPVGGGCLTKGVALKTATVGLKKGTKIVIK